VPALTVILTLFLTGRPIYNYNLYIGLAYEISTVKCKITATTSTRPAFKITVLLIWIWIFSRQGPQTGASHRRAVVCEQLAQGYYLRVLGVAW